MEEIAVSIWRWTAPHPEYRPRAEEVASYALATGDALALVDPLLPADPAREAQVLAGLDGLTRAARRLELLISIPYHTRSAERLFERYAGHMPVRLWGHAHVRRRLAAHTPLQEIPLGATGTATEVAGGIALAYTIGRPRRDEHPLYFPELRAVAFGDAVVGTQSGLRLWNQSASTGAVWYRDVFAPTLEGLAAQDIECVLVTHGPAAVRDGRRALSACLAAAPVRRY